MGESATKFCKHCGSTIPADAVICTNCGRQVEELHSETTASQPQIVINNSNMNTNTNNNVNGGVIGKPKNKTTAIILCCIGFFGLGGLHKFYEGKFLMGLIYLFTGGLAFIGTIIDLIVLLGKPSTYYV